ncbi:MAG: DUF2235 domain-containing protein [Aliishimia sp.]
MTENPSAITAQSEAASGDMQGSAGNIAQTCPAVTLEIGVFFDGTGNNTANTQSEGFTASYNSARSNVSLLYPLYKNGSDFDVPNDCGGVKTKYASIYKEGIGTSAGWSDYTPTILAGGATGTGLTGVESRVFDACVEVGTIISRLSPAEEPKEIILDVFGFSRGAAAARYFVNCFRQGFVDYLELYVNPKRAYLPEGRNVTIRFVGIFDTVAAIGFGTDDDNGPVNVHMSTAQAEKIYHLTAKHEYRDNFRLNHNAPNGGDTREMLGAHSDVGGGYRGTGDSILVDRTNTRVFLDHATAQAAHSADTAAAAASRNAAQSFWVQDGWIRPNEPTGGLENAPSPLMTRRVSDRRGGWHTRYTYATGAELNRPWVQVGLSRIPLKIMYDQGKAVSVPFTALPTGGEYQIPGPLSTLAGSLENGGALPTGTNRREILRNYGHVSSNLNKIGMRPQLGVGNQRMWHRTIYPNDAGQAK